MKHDTNVLLLSAVLLLTAVSSMAQVKTDTTNQRSLYDRYLDSQEKRGRHIERVNREDLKATLEEARAYALEHKRPVIVECMVSPDQLVMPWIPGGKSFDDILL